VCQEWEVVGYFSRVGLDVISVDTGNESPLDDIVLIDGDA
jgi:hypothetical protein